MLFQYYRDEPVLNNANIIIDLEGDYITDPPKLKAKITGQTNCSR